MVRREEEEAGAGGRGRGGEEEGRVSVSLVVTVCFGCSGFQTYWQCYPWGSCVRRTVMLVSGTMGF